MSVHPNVTLDAIEAAQAQSRGRTVRVDPIASKTIKEFTSWKLDWMRKVNADARLKPDSYARVGTALAFFINSATYQAFPSQKTIARSAAVSIATVKKAVSELERLGYLRVGKRGRTNLYRFPRDLHFIDEIRKMEPE